MENQKSILSINLKRVRKERGWSQEGAAKEIGISRQRLASYEEGRAECSIKTLLKICTAYKIENLESFLKTPVVFCNENS